MRRSSVRLPHGTRARDNAGHMTDSTPPSHTHRVTLLIAIVGALVAGYATWRADNTRDREDASRDRLQQLETSNTALRTELSVMEARENKIRDDLQSQMQELEKLPQQVRDLTASLDDLRARTERPQRAWTRAEAFYLIELAQRRLNFDRDTQTAIAALESADMRLASLRDPSLAAIRTQVAKDLQALRAVPIPDRTGINAQLRAIETQSRELPIKGHLIGVRTADTTARDASFWQRAWNTVAAPLRNLFSVRRLDATHEIVTAEEQTLRHQHFALLAFAARHAVLRGDEVAYRTTLDYMRAVLGHYFADSPATTAIDRQLSELRAIDIAPPLPDLTATTKLLGHVPAAGTAQ